MTESPLSQLAQNRLTGWSQVICKHVISHRTRGTEQVNTINLYLMGLIVYLQQQAESTFCARMHDAITGRMSISSGEVYPPDYDPIVSTSDPDVDMHEQVKTHKSITRTKRVPF